MTCEIVVGLLNWGCNPAEISFTLLDLGVIASQGYAVQDLWADSHNETT